MSGEPDRSHAQPAGNGSGETRPDTGGEAEAMTAAGAPEDAQATEERSGEEASGEPEARDLAAALAAEKARADENWERYLRVAAELDNMRKRAERDMENVRKFALERFAGELLAVKDSLELGLQAAEENPTAESLLEGTRSTLRQLASVLERFGVVEVNPEGEPFDPELHEAMTTQPSTDVEPNTVLTVYQKGYTLHGRLLRPARVVVAAAPPEGA